MVVNGLIVLLLTPEDAPEDADGIPEDPIIEVFGVMARGLEKNEELRDGRRVRSRQESKNLARVMELADPRMMFFNESMCSLS